MSKFKERIASKELNEAYERIAELEAKAAADREYMDGAEKRILALEHILKQTTGQREYAATRRAEQAEAALTAQWEADKRLVVALEQAEAENKRLRERLDDCLRGHYGLDPAP